MQQVDAYYFLDGGLGRVAEFQLHQKGCDDKPRKTIFRSLPERLRDEVFAHGEILQGAFTPIVCVDPVVDFLPARIDSAVSPFGRPSNLGYSIDEGGCLFFRERGRAQLESLFERLELLHGGIIVLGGAYLKLTEEPLVPIEPRQEQTQHGDEICHRVVCRPR